jgi:hypothetical protein
MALSGREIDVNRNWTTYIFVGIAACACSETPPSPTAPPSAVTSTSTQPAINASPPPGNPPSPISENLPASRLDANPPGTPSYVIAPGDSVGGRNSQIPRLGGRPAF